MLRGGFELVASRRVSIWARFDTILHAASSNRPRSVSQRVEPCSNRSCDVRFTDFQSTATSHELCCFKPSQPYPGCPVNIFLCNRRYFIFPYHLASRPAFSYDAYITAAWLQRLVPKRLAFSAGGCSNRCLHLATYVRLMQRCPLPMGCFTLMFCIWVAYIWTMSPIWRTRRRNHLVFTLCMR